MQSRLTMIAAVGLLTGSLTACHSGPPVGARAPAFSAYDDRGAEASLAAYEGKVVVLDFWATWCAPCLPASPSIQALHERFAGSGDVVVLGVHYDDRGDPAAYMVEHGYTFPVVLDGTEVVEAFGISQIPTFLVIDRHGTVVYSQTGFAPSVAQAIADAVSEHRSGES